MSNMNTIYGLIVLMILIFLIRQAKKNKLWRLIQSQDTKKLEDELEKTSTRILIKAYKRENLKLNCYMMEKNKKKINEQFEKMFPIHKNEKDNREFLVKMFNYYLFEENQKKCRQLLNSIKAEIKQEAIVKETEMLYQIFFEGCSDYIDPLIHQLGNLQDEQKGMAAYYIAVQYRNLGNKSKQEEYEKLSKKYLS